MRRLMMMTAVLALLATACKAEANVMFEIRADGSGTLAAEIGFDDELLGLIGSEDIAGGLFQELDLAGLGEGVQERREGEFTYYTTSTSFSSAAELDALLAAENSLSFDGSFDVVVDEDEIRITAATEDTSGLVEGDLPFGLGGDQLEEFFSAHVRINVPGGVTSNADRILPDGTLEWDLPLDGGPLTIDVVADLEPGGGFPFIPVLIGAAVVAALVAVFVVLRGRRPDAAEVRDPIAATWVPAEGAPAEDDEAPVV